MRAARFSSTIRLRVFSMLMILPGEKRGVVEGSRPSEDGIVTFDAYSTTPVLVLLLR